MLPTKCTLFLYLVLQIAADLPPDATTVAPPKKKVCDVCKCQETEIDCASLGLEEDLSDHEWPQDRAFKVVSFANNRISRVKQFPNATVERLVLSNNSISRIDLRAFGNLVNLTVLDLSYNRLTHNNFTDEALEGKFKSQAWQPLDHLRVLNLSGNQLHTLKQDIFGHVVDLRTLILSNNPFYIFDQIAINAISEFQKLQELDLSRCHLERLDESTFSVGRKMVKKLNLGWNNFTQLPHALIPQMVLETLILDGNPIEILDSTHKFPVMDNLKELHMSNMSKLREIRDGALSDLGSLEVLVIENCSQLTNIEVNAWSKQPEIGGRTWPTLKKLFLSNNALRYLPPNLVAQWDQLEEMHVMNNQWSCDCDNQHFIDIILPKFGATLMGNETDDLLCASPPEFENRTLVSLASMRHLRCLNPYASQPGRDAAILVGALIGVLLAVPVTLVLFLLWSRGFFFCGRQSPASFSRAFYKRTSRYDEDY